MVKANIDDNDCPFPDASIHIDNGKLNTKINDERDDCSFGIVNYPFLDDEVSLSPLYGVNLLHFVRFQY